MAQPVAAVLDPMPSPVSDDRSAGHTAASPAWPYAASHSAALFDQAPASRWAALPLHDRLRTLTRARHRIAEQTEVLTAAISSALPRTSADTLVAEILPLLAALRFLEREAAHVLAPRRLGGSGRPFWLPGVTHRVERVPHGRVLILAPGNYPLLLPGVQALQALAAGNSVVWKPGRGGEPVARAFTAILFDAGVPREVLTVTGESVAEAEHALSSRPDLIVLTGSAATGRKVLARAAETLTPVLAELSGCDSVVVLPGADLARVVKALAFGMRLNGSATCMAPRRVLLVATGDRARDAARRTRFVDQLEAALATIAPVPLSRETTAQLQALVRDARAQGATIAGPGAATLEGAVTSAAPLSIGPVLLLDASTMLEAAHIDIFAPLLTLIDVDGDAGVLAAESASPFALTCSIFGPERRARAIAAQLRCGTVLINDLIAPTADPRVPFGGRGESGFGVTRGAEGLLAMTAVRVCTTRRGGGTRHLEPTTTAQESLFRAVARLGYAGSWRSRLAGARAAVRAARNLGEQ